MRLDLRLTVDTHAGVAAMAAAAARHGRVARLHLKVNTGMNRMGAAPGEVVGLAAAIAGHPELSLEALWTHCAVADEPENPFTDVQLDRFEDVWAELDRRGLAPPMRHAANTAAGMDHPRSRYDLVRAGIGIYGLAPSPALAGRVDLVPALTLRAEVAMVKRVPAGESISYGQAHTFARDANVATVPIGYADGVTRRLSFTGGQVLIGGRRCPIVGAVTMDQLMVDCGDDPVDVGDEVVLIGAQGDEVIGAQEWADRLDTIGYEIVCGIGPRVPRHYRRAGAGRRGIAGGGVGPTARARSGGRSGRMRAVPSPGGHPARRARRRGQHLHPVPAGRGTHPGGVRCGRPRCRPDVRRGGTGRRGGSPGPALRGAVGPAAGPAHARGDGLDPRPGVHRQRGQVPAAGQP